MEAREAIKIAKQHVTAMFQDDGISNVGLEEIAFDDARGTWEITVGFSRPWDERRNPLTREVLGFEGRTYKRVDVADGDGRVLGVRNREVAA